MAIELYHYGLEGMKWGHRRWQYEDGRFNEAGKERYFGKSSNHRPKSVRELQSSGSNLDNKKRIHREKTLNADLNEQTHLKVKTKRGQTIAIDQTANDKFQRLLAKGFKAVNNNMLNTKSMDLSIDGKKIGNVEIFQESKDSVNIVWLGVNKKERGHGYATSVLTEVLNECRRRGYKQCTLEVPGESPDARHIYEKLGFKEIGTVTSSDEDFVWGGLTAMKIDLRK